MSSDSVRVVTRVRPFIKSEEKECRCFVSVSTQDRCVRVCDKRKKCDPNEPSSWRSFEFDHVFGPESTQENVYASSVRPALARFTEGFNTTIFAYGQTSSGKTHTMMGQMQNPADTGLIPRAVEQVFEMIGSSSDSSVRFIVTLSYLEIYNEKVRDLLSKPPTPEKGLRIRQSPSGGFHVPALSKHLVTSVVQIVRLIQKGGDRRATAATHQNSSSSRSHSILVLTLERGNEVEGHLTVTTSKLNMVDLAGSERFQAQSVERQIESSSINKSLNTLGNVIAALSGTQGKANGGKTKGKLFVPYRNSALTMLLQDSLGGNSHTLMVANVNPCDRNVMETMSTLRYATRAKKIRNKARKNLNAKDAILVKLQQEIEALKAAVLEKDTIIQTMSNNPIEDNEAIEDFEDNLSGLRRESREVSEDEANDDEQASQNKPGHKRGQSVVVVDGHKADRLVMIKRLQSCRNAVIQGGRHAESKDSKEHQNEQVFPNTRKKLQRSTSAGVSDAVLAGLTHDGLENSISVTELLPQLKIAIAEELKKTKTKLNELQIETREAREAIAATEKKANEFKKQAEIREQSALKEAAKAKNELKSARRSIMVISKSFGLDSEKVEKSGGTDVFGFGALGDERELASFKLRRSAMMAGVHSSGISGWLLKRGAINKSFKRRFCKLRAETVDNVEQLCLSYYKKKTDTKPRGEVIITEDTDIERGSDADDGSSLEFIIVTPRRRFVFRAEDETILDMWVLAASAVAM